MSADYLVIHVTLTQRELMAQSFRGASRQERETHLKDYLETVGLRPRHGCGTMEIWQDVASSTVHYRQHIPKTDEDGA